MDQKLLTFIHSVADSTVVIVSSCSQLNSLRYHLLNYKKITFWIRPQNTTASDKTVRHPGSSSNTSILG